MKRILITARDPSTGFDLIRIINYLLREKDIFLFIFAEEPAYSIICKNTNFRFKNKKVNYFLLNELTSIDKKIKLKENILTLKPDIILTGISGPDFGIDEICIQISKELNFFNTFSLQSYWGDINPNFKEKANNYFVIDEYAAEITKKRSPEANIYITGNQQYKKWISHNWKKSRETFRNKYKIDENKRIISFFSQPLFKYKFYWETIFKFLDIISKEYKDYLLIIKAHPKDVDSFQNKLSESCKSLEINYLFLKDENILEVISASDITVSLYSTVCYTAQIMLSQASYPFTIPVYLFFNRDLKDYYKKTCFLDNIPLSDNKKSILINSVQTIKESLVMSLDINFRLEVLRSIKKRFILNKKDPAKEIVKILLESKKQKK